jgi:hypothetical protein
MIVRKKQICNTKREPRNSLRGKPKMPDYKKINECHKMIDFLQDWVRHELQPEAYMSTADSLEVRAAYFLSQVEEKSKKG